MFFPLMIKFILLNSFVHIIQEEREIPPVLCSYYSMEQYQCIERIISIPVIPSGPGSLFHITALAHP